MHRCRERDCLHIQFASFDKTGWDSRFLSVAGNSPCSAQPLRGAGRPNFGAADAPVPPARHTLLAPNQPETPRSLSRGFLPPTGLMAQAASTPIPLLFTSRTRKKPSCTYMQRNGNFRSIFPSRQVSWPCWNPHHIPSPIPPAPTPNGAEFSKYSPYVCRSEAG